MKKTILIAALLAVILLVAGGFYSRPVRLTQLYPELGLDSCKGITAYYSADSTGEENRAAFPSGSEEFDLLIGQIQDQKFRKSLLNLLPSGTQAHRWTEGDFKWEIILEFEDPISMQEDSSGTLLHLTNFFGDLTLYNLTRDQSIRCHVKNQQQWAEEILHILSGK